MIVHAALLDSELDWVFADVGRGEDPASLQVLRTALTAKDDPLFCSRCCELRYEHC